MITSTKFWFYFFIIGVLFLSSCEREYDEPPFKSIPTGQYLTISELRQMFADSSSVRFTDSFSVLAVALNGEKSGNFYKNIYVKDNTDAIRLNLLYSGGIYQGDSIRIYLNGLTLTQDNYLLVLDSVDIDKNVVKLANERTITPIKTSLAEILDTANFDLYESQLIQLDSVEFVGTDVGNTYATPPTQSESRMLTHCDSTIGEIIVYNSGYADFADEPLPSGNGTFIGILARYGINTKQLYVRSTSEVNFNNPRCTYIPPSVIHLTKDFDDGTISTWGWTSHWTGTNANGTNWGEWGIFGGDVAACSNFDISSFTNYATTSWMISPAVDLSNANNPFAIFDNTVRYNGPQLQFYVSTDYTGSGDPATNGTWTDLSSSVTWNADLSTWDWTSSGHIDLTNYKSPNTYIAFKYTGSNIDGATWEIDNIFIKSY